MTQPTKPRLSVHTFRDAGVEARWGKNRSRRPILLVRLPNDATWWLLTKGMWQAIENGQPVKDVVYDHTVLGKFFSISI